MASGEQRRWILSTVHPRMFFFFQFSVFAFMTLVLIASGSDAKEWLRNAVTWLLMGMQVLCIVAALLSARMPVGAKPEPPLEPAAVRTDGQGPAV